MTNEEKAKELKANDVCCVWNGGCPNVYNAAIKMADWKDAQFAEEKKEWIEKAQHVLGNILVGGVHPQGIQGFIKQFQQAMEE